MFLNLLSKKYFFIILTAFALVVEIEINLKSQIQIITHKLNQFKNYTKNQLKVKLKNNSKINV